VNGVGGTCDPGHGGLAEISMEAERSGRHRAVRNSTVGNRAVGNRAAGSLGVGLGAGVGGTVSGTVSGAATAGGAMMTDTRAGDDDTLLFTRAVLDYAAQRPGQPLALLQAGCATAGDDPDVGTLRAAGCDLAVSLIDDDVRPARATVTANYELVTCTLCDLRVAPLVPRSFDIVHCALLLERISHAELVLDRLMETVKPGGLLLLQTGDRDCAAGFLDRRLPRPLRATIWRSLKPGEPGPYPAVYERLVSGRGIESYVQRRGLVIAQRQALNHLAGQRKRPGLLLAARLAARLSRGRLTSAHDELRFVIRKPENRFARVL
jgi:SAM-dependent methyltransferase